MRTDATKTKALILAGRRSGEIDPLAAVDGVPHKALLIAGGKPLIRRVAEAVAESKAASTILVSAPDDVRAPIAAALANISDWRFVDPSDSPAGTVLAAIESLNAEENMLVTTCDHALLRAEIIRRFVAEAATSDAAAACVERQAYLSRFPDSRRTFIRLKDLQFSGANLFWFAGARSKGLADYWRKLEAKRKNPAAMAREIGLFSALAYLTGQMTRRGLERAIERKTNVRAKLVALPDAEAAIDVDKPDDLTLVRRILALD